MQPPADGQDFYSWMKDQADAAMRSGAELAYHLLESAMLAVTTNRVTGEVNNGSTLETNREKAHFIRARMNEVAAAYGGKYVPLPGYLIFLYQDIDIYAEIYLVKADLCRQIVEIWEADR